MEESADVTCSTQTSEATHRGTIDFLSTSERVVMREKEAALSHGGGFGTRQASTDHAFAAKKRRKTPSASYGRRESLGNLESPRNQAVGERAFRPGAVRVVGKKKAIITESLSANSTHGRRQAVARRYLHDVDCVDDDIEILDTAAEPQARPRTSASQPNRLGEDASPADMRTGHCGTVSYSKTSSYRKKDQDSRQPQATVGMRGGRGAANIAVPTAKRTEAEAEWVNSSVFCGFEVAESTVTALTPPGPALGTVEKHAKSPATATPSLSRASKATGKEPSQEKMDESRAPSRWNNIPSPASSEIIIDYDSQDDGVNGEGSRPVAKPAKWGRNQTALEGGEDVPRVDQAGPGEVGGANVKDAVAAVVGACETFLPADEFRQVKRKLVKYVNSLAPQFLCSPGVKAYIETRWAQLEAGRNNIYILIRDILDELKKYRSAEVVSGTTSELSDTGYQLPQHQAAVPSKKWAVLTTIGKPVRLSTKAEAQIEETPTAPVNEGSQANSTVKEDSADRTGPAGETEGQAAPPGRGLSIKFGMSILAASVKKER